MMKITLAVVSVLALFASGALGQDKPVLTGADAFGDFTKDAPGVRRLIKATDLEPPGKTESSSNAPATVAMPEGALPKVPEGFRAEMVATGIDNPRAIRFAPNGDLFVANSEPGQVLVLHFDDPSQAKPTSQEVFVDKLNQPYGIAFYPADNPQWIYIAESDGLKRYPYKAGDMKAEGEGESILTGIPAEHHWTRDVAFSPDGKTMYYSVGSGSNVGLDMTMDPKPPNGDLEGWIAAHPLGVAWGGEERRAAVLSFDPEGKNEQYFATGLRNCAGMTVQPATGDVWCAVNERDELGDNVPFDYATAVKGEAFYGWPWFYIGENADPRWKETPREDLKGKITIPDVLFQAHSAPLNIAFYTSDAWGPDYKNDAFVTLHGSWNRGTRTGYKVVKLDFDESGKPTGEYMDFMTGFVQDAANVWGRPVGVAVSKEGALFVSDDGSGSIWKVTKEQ